ncbi:MAG: hypothetical protein FWF46_09200 [Oscillospiraceae bacterium]|nr:hypothetical protein [Oscillospiraceae bacterium]
MGQTSIIDEIKVSVKINSEEFTNAIAKIQSSIKDLNNTMANSSKETLSYGKTMGDMFKTIGNNTLLDTMKKNINAVGEDFEKQMKTVSGFGGTAGAVFTNIGDGIKSMGTAIATNPIGTLVTVFGLLMNSSEEFRDIVQSLLKSALEPIGKVMGSIMEAIQPLFGVLGSLLTTILTPLIPILQVIGKVIEAAFSPFERVGSFVSGAVDGLSKLLGFKSDGKTAEELQKIAEAADEVRKSSSESAKELENQATALEHNEQIAGSTKDGQKNLVQAYKDGAQAIKDSGEAVADYIVAHGLEGDAVDKLKDKQRNYEEAVKGTLDVKKELEGIERGFADTQLAVMDAHDKFIEKQNALTEARKKYKEGSDELKRAELELESAQSKLTTAQEKQDAQQNTLNQSTYLLSEAELNQQVELTKLQKETGNQGVKYDELNQKLQKLKDDGTENSMQLREQTIKDLEEQGLKWSENSQGIISSQDWFRERMIQNQEDLKQRMIQHSQEASDGIKNRFSGVGNNFENWFANVPTQTGKAMAGIEPVLTTSVNGAIDKTNKVLGNFQFTIPDWVDNVGGKTFKLQKMPKLAQGGIIDRPTMALIGEAGREAIMPLENNTGWIDSLAERLNQKGNGQPVQVVVKLGENTIFNKIIEGIKQKSFERNEGVFSV